MVPETSQRALAPPTAKPTPLPGTPISRSIFKSKAQRPVSEVTDKTAWPRSCWASALAPGLSLPYLLAPSCPRALTGPVQSCLMHTLD